MGAGTFYFLPALAGLFRPMDLQPVYFAFSTLSYPVAIFGS